jgi:hypothetical protein
LEELELETELLLCGLSKPENYPRELEERMKIPKPQVDLLVNEMNEFVFKKIREKLIENTEKEEMFIKKAVAEENKIPTETIPRPEISNTKKPTGESEKIIGKSESSILKKAGIEIEPTKNIPQVPNGPKTEPPVEKKVESIPFQKLSGSFQIPTIKTEYSLNNISKQETKKDPNLPPISSKIDPYRANPNE